MAFWPAAGVTLPGSSETTWVIFAGIASSCGRRSPGCLRRRVGLELDRRVSTFGSLMLSKTTWLPFSLISSPSAPRIGPEAAAADQLGVAVGIAEIGRVLPFERGATFAVRAPE